MKKLLLPCALLCLLQLSACGDAAQTDAEEKQAMLPMVMVDGTLYLDTGYESDMARCGVMDGEIVSSVSGSEQPTEDDQSNFGEGYGYQIGAADGTIEVYIDQAWRIFATDEVRQELQLDTESQ